MRQFVVAGHGVPTTPDFALEDLPGAGRLDLLARSLLAGLLVSHGVREDARVHLVLDDALTLSVDGASVRGLHPDERSTAARIRSALERADEAVGHRAVDVGPGLALRRRGLEGTLAALDEESTLVALRADGEPVETLPTPRDPAFVLSDERAFPDAERDFLSEYADRSVSLGPVALHADHAIAVAHNTLDAGRWREE